MRLTFLKHPRQSIQKYPEVILLWLVGTSGKMDENGQRDTTDSWAIERSRVLKFASCCLCMPVVHCPSLALVKKIQKGQPSMFVESVCSARRDANLKEVLGCSQLVLGKEIDQAISNLLQLLSI